MPCCYKNGTVSCFIAFVHAFFGWNARKRVVQKRQKESTPALFQSSMIVHPFHALPYALLAESGRMQKGVKHAFRARGKSTL